MRHNGRTGRILYYNPEISLGYLIPDEVMPGDRIEGTAKGHTRLKFATRSFSQDMTEEDRRFLTDNSIGARVKKISFDSSRGDEERKSKKRGTLIHNIRRLKH